MRGRPLRSGDGDGQFASGFVSAVILFAGLAAAVRVSQWLVTTDLYAWATATRTAEFSYLGVFLDLLGPLFILIMIGVVFAMLQLHGGSSRWSP